MAIGRCLIRPAHSSVPGALQCSLDLEKNGCVIPGRTCQLPPASRRPSMVVWIYPARFRPSNARCVCAWNCAGVWSLGDTIHHRGVRCRRTGPGSSCRNRFPIVCPCRKIQATGDQTGPCRACLARAGGTMGARWPTGSGPTYRRLRGKVCRAFNVSLVHACRQVRCGVSLVSLLYGRSKLHRYRSRLAIPVESWFCLAPLATAVTRRRFAEGLVVCRASACATFWIASC